MQINFSDSILCSNFTLSNEQQNTPQKMDTIQNWIDEIRTAGKVTRTNCSKFLNKKSLEQLKSVAREAGFYEPAVQNADKVSLVRELSNEFIHLVNT